MENNIHTFYNFFTKMGIAYITTYNLQVFIFGNIFELSPVIKTVVVGNALTLYPSCSNNSVRCDPIKPSAPVIRACFIWLSLLLFSILEARYKFETGCFVPARAHSRQAMTHNVLRVSGI